MTTLKEKRDARDREYNELRSEMELMKDRMQWEWRQLTVQQVRAIQRRYDEIRHRMLSLEKQRARDAGRAGAK